MPASVVHYSRYETVKLIIENALKSKDGELTIRLSCIDDLNDPMEGNFIWNRYFTTSTKKQKLKIEWKKYLNDHKPFIFSTCATNNKSRDKGKLPMWAMYGDNTKGAIIRFNCKKLKYYLEGLGHIFMPVNYSSTNEAGKIVAELNLFCFDFKRLIMEGCLTKHTDWEYEQEWRLIVFSNDNIKTNADKTFIEIKLPISLVEEICLGPSCSITTIHKMQEVKHRFIEAHPDKNVHFKVTKSKINIK